MKLQLTSLRMVMAIFLSAQFAFGDPIVITVQNLDPAYISNVKEWVISNAIKRKCLLDIKSINTWNVERKLNTVTAILVGVMDCSSRLSGLRGAFSGLITVGDTSFYNRNLTTIDLSVQFASEDGIQTFPAVTDTQNYNTSSGKIGN